MAIQYINKVGVFSFGKILAAIYGIIGLIVGAFMSLLTLATGIRMGGAGFDVGLMSGFGAMITIPIIYAMIGYVGGVILAVVFNGVTGLVGGLEIDIE
jgi:hypothetical protein